MACGLCGVIPLPWAVPFHFHSTARIAWAGVIFAMVLADPAARLDLTFVELWQNLIQLERFITFTSTRDCFCLAMAHAASTLTGAGVDDNRLLYWYRFLVLRPFAVVWERLVQIPVISACFHTASRVDWQFSSG